MEAYGRPKTVHDILRKTDIKITDIDDETVTTAGLNHEYEENLGETHQLPLIVNKQLSGQKSSSGLRAQYGAGSIEKEGLPPAPTKGLIASDNYYVNREPGKGKRHKIHDLPDVEKSWKVRSLPNSSGSKDLLEDSARHTSSAPHRDQPQNPSPTRPKPRINTLVKGELKSDEVATTYPNATKQWKKDDVAGAKANRGRNKASDKKFLSLLKNNFKSPEVKVTKRYMSPEKESSSSDGAVTMEKRTKEVTSIYNTGAKSQMNRDKKQDPFHAKVQKEKTELPKEVEEKLLKSDSNADIGTTIVLGGVNKPPPHRAKAQQNKLFQQENTIIFNADKEKDGQPTVKPASKKEKTIAFKDPNPYSRQKSRVYEKKEKSMHIPLASEAPPPDPTKETYTLEDHVNVYVSEFVRIKTKTTLDRKIIKGRQKSAKKRNVYTDPLRNIPPWHRKEYVLNKRETAMYKHITNVYGNEDLRKQRKNDFYRRVLELQLENWRQMHEEYQKMQQKKIETKVQQKRALKRLRDKFEDDQVKRFRTQYVTSRILQHEWVDRHEYGLPDDINHEPEYVSKLKLHSRKPESTFDFKSYYFKNKKRYDKLFKAQFGPEWYRNMKVPKMEGIDVVDLNDLDGVDNNGEPLKSRKIKVSDLVDDAEKMLDYDSDDSLDIEGTKEKVSAETSNQGTKRKKQKPVTSTALKKVSSVYSSSPKRWKPKTKMSIGGGNASKASEKSGEKLESPVKQQHTSTKENPYAQAKTKRTGKDAGILSPNKSDLRAKNAPIQTKRITSYDNTTSNKNSSNDKLSNIPGSASKNLGKQSKDKRKGKGTEPYPEPKEKSWQSGDRIIKLGQTHKEDDNIANSKYRERQTDQIPSKMTKYSSPSSLDDSQTRLGISEPAKDPNIPALNKHDGNIGPKNGDMTIDRIPSRKTKHFNDNKVKDSQKDYDRMELSGDARITAPDKQDERNVINSAHGVESVKELSEAGKTERNNSEMRDPKNTPSEKALMDDSKHGQLGSLKCTKATGLAVSNENVESFKKPSLDKKQLDQNKLDENQDRLVTPSTEDVRGKPVKVGEAEGSTNSGENVPAEEPSPTQELETSTKDKDNSNGLKGNADEENAAQIRPSSKHQNNKEISLANQTCEVPKADGNRGTDHSKLNEQISKGKEDPNINSDSTCSPTTRPAEESNPISPSEKSKALNTDKPEDSEKNRYVLMPGDLKKDGNLSQNGKEDEQEATNYVNHQKSQDNIDHRTQPERNNEEDHGHQFKHRPPSSGVDQEEPSKDSSFLLPKPGKGTDNIRNMPRDTFKTEQPKPKAEEEVSKIKAAVKGDANKSNNIPVENNQNNPSESHYSASGEAKPQNAQYNGQVTPISTSKALPALSSPVLANITKQPPSGNLASKEEIPELIHQTRKPSPIVNNTETAKCTKEPKQPPRGNIDSSEDIPGSSQAKKPDNKKKDADNNDSRPDTRRDPYSREESRKSSRFLSQARASTREKSKRPATKPITREKENKRPNNKKLVPEKQKFLSKPKVDMDLLEQLVTKGPKSKKKEKEGQAKPKKPNKNKKKSNKISDNLSDNGETALVEPQKPTILNDTDRPDIPDDLLRVTDDEASDDEDIFEKAMRKYGIVIDSDEE